MEQDRRPFYWLESLFWNLHSYTWDDPSQIPGELDRIQARVDWLLRHRQRDHERVLDLGCGTGNYAVALAEAGFEVVGVDFARGMLRKARQKVERRPHLRTSTTFEHGDLNEALSFPDGSFDHAICVYAFQCVSDPLRFLTDVLRVLKPGGLFLITAPPPGSEARVLAKSTVPRRAFLKLKAFASKSKRVRRRSRDELVTLLTNSGFGMVEERLDSRAIELLCQAPGR